jgi:hypothetical protein
MLFFHAMNCKTLIEAYNANFNNVGALVVQPTENGSIPKESNVQNNARRAKQLMNCA